jgi:NAD(P)-dependent dehydrogenase (short-subunit alcohol dehydrogenase family)
MAMSGVETIAQPDRVADDIGWGSITLVCIHRSTLSIIVSYFVSAAGSTRLDNLLRLCDQIQGEEQVSSLEGKVALVTGGSGGIGRAVCLHYAREGAKVVLSARRAAEGEETAAMIRDGGGDAVFVQGDVTRVDDVENMVAACVENYGRVDIACNNAGIEGAIVPLSEFTEEDFDAVMDVNVKGAWLCMRAELKQMIGQGSGGAIVNMGSVAGVIGLPNAGPYTASKHALIGLTKTAAQENAEHGVRVNVVCPALIETGMADRFTGGKDSDTEAFIMSLTQLRRRGTVEEVAAAVLYLSGEQSSYVTGHSLIIDGGVTSI